MRSPRLSAVLFALAFGLAAPLAAQLQRLSEVFPLAGPLPSAAGSGQLTQGSPLAAALPHGFAVASWKWRTSSVYREAVDGRLLDLSGAPGPGFVGPELGEYADPTLQEPALAPLGAGGFVVVSILYPWTVSFHRFAPGGVGLDSRYGGAANSGDVRVSTPSVAGNAVGSFAVAWEGGGVAVRTFAPSGSPITPEIYVDPKGTGYPRQPRVGIDAAGRFVVIWRGSATSTSPARLCGQAYGARGGFLGGLFCAGDLAGSTAGALALDPAGKFLVTWFAPPPTGNRTPLFVRPYQMDGTPLGDPVQVAASADPSQLTASADRQGNTALSWQEGDRFRVLLVGRDGRVRGTAISISGVASHPGVDANGLALADSGRLLITWRSGDFLVGQLWQARF